jgi:hypothetical protein
MGFSRWIYVSNLCKALDTFLAHFRGGKVVIMRATPPKALPKIVSPARWQAAHRIADRIPQRAKMPEASALVGTRRKEPYR